MLGPKLTHRHSLVNGGSSFIGVEGKTPNEHLLGGPMADLAILQHARGLPSTFARARSMFLQPGFSTHAASFWILVRHDVTRIPVVIT